MSINEIIESIQSSTEAGYDLSLSGELLELEVLAKPIYATNSDGKRVADDFSEREPDWGLVERRCEGFLRKSRDLRIAAFYAAALLRTNRLEGFAQGLCVILELLSQSTYQAHPQPENRDTIVERWYTVTALAAPYRRDGDLLRIVEGLRSMPLVKTNAWTFCYRDVLAARNKSGGADLTLLERMKAEWRNLASADRAELIGALRTAITTTEEIERVLLEQTPDALAPSSNGGRPLQVLLQELKGMADFGGELLVQKKVEKAETKGNVKASMPEGINSRADAVRVLNEVAEFFRKTEPASPVPYFLDRASRLVDRDFMGLLDELAPDAVPVFQNLAGVGKETSSNR